MIEVRTIDADALQERLKKKKPDPAAPRYVDGFNDALMRFKSMVHSAPTIKQERKKGKWINHQNDGYVDCPFCGALTTCSDGIEDLHFCFSCGAELEGEKE